MKNTLTLLLIITIFLGGFMVGRLKPFKTKEINRTELMISNLKADDLKKLSDIYVDSANKEIINYYSKYLYRHSNLLPNYYITYYKDSVEFNKENFFYYYSMYKITDYLSNAKSCVINSLINEYNRGKVDSLLIP